MRPASSELFKSDVLSLPIKPIASNDLEVLYQQVFDSFTDEGLSIEKHSIEQCVPSALPFPPSKIKNTAFQMIDQRYQFMDFNGSFVLTNPNALPPGGQVQKFNIDTAAVDLFVIGDIGGKGPQQSNVLNSIAREVKAVDRQKSNPMVIGLGDWVYPRGPQSTHPNEKARIHSTVLNACKTLLESTILYAVLGNHEYGDYYAPASPDAFMAIVRDFGVEMPGRYYCVQINGSDFNVDYFMLDSSVLACDEQQIQWLTQVVNDSLQLENDCNKPCWRIVAAHHPLQSHGLHDQETVFLKDLLKEVLPHIDLYLCGHEHDIEYIQGEPGIPDLFLTGTGSSQRNVARGDRTLFASSQAGFGRLKISSQKLEIQCKAVSDASKSEQKANNTSDPTSLVFERSLEKPRFE